MLRVNLEGSNRAFHGEHSADSVMSLARLLIAAGFPDQPFVCYRGEMPCLKYRSLVWAAGHYIREEPVLRIERYRLEPSKNSEHGFTRETDGHATGTSERLHTVEASEAVPPA